MNETAPDEGTNLPELGDRRLAELESALFRRIGADKRETQRRRRRVWLGAGAAAAVVVVAAVIAPLMPAILGGSAGSQAESAGSAADAPAPEWGADSGAGAATDGAAEDSDQGADAAERDIIATAAATVVVDDVAAAAEDIADEAVDRGGYVESMSIGTGVQGQVYDQLEPYAEDVASYPAQGAWITVRVPSDELTGMLGALSEVGDVTASSIDRYDVTSQTVDLQARIDAAQASVDRLTELMSQAGDLDDLLAAESALAERQATLESYQQELKSLDDQVAMSSLTVTLVPQVEAVEADPAGFGDGLVAGWNGLVATLNGIVVALGFMLPWLVVIAVVLLAVWGARRALRRRRAAASARPEPEDPAD